MSSEAEFRSNFKVEVADNIGMSQARQVLKGTTYLVTRRCIQRRFLLLADSVVNRAFVYCLGLASQKYQIQIHGYCVMSNHYHLILTDVEGKLPEFMAWLNRILALCIKTHRRWPGVLWDPNVHYNAVVLSTEEAVWDKLRYVLLNPVRAALVRRVCDYTGALSNVNLMRQGSVVATRPKVYFDENQWPNEVVLQLVVPKVLRNRAYHATLEQLISEQERQARLQGRPRLHNQSKITPFSAPNNHEAFRKREPRFAAVTSEGLRQAARALQAFRQAYREAYNRWKAGLCNTIFPAGTWWYPRYAGAFVESG